MAVSINLKTCITIPDSFEGYGPKLFCLPNHYTDLVDKVLIPAGMVQDRVEKLAGHIFSDIMLREEVNISALCVLKGGFRFYSELMNKLNALNTVSSRSVPIKMEFIRMKSYVDTVSTGEVKIIGMDNLVESLKGRDVLIVEDMIETGKTLQKLLTTMKKYV